MAPGSFGDTHSLTLSHTHTQEELSWALESPAGEEALQFFLNLANLFFPWVVGVRAGAGGFGEGVTELGEGVVSARYSLC